MSFASRIALLASFTLLAPAGQAFGQAALISPESDIERRLREAEQDYDISQRRYVLGQKLAEDQRARHTFLVERGVTYFGLALCEDACGGMDVLVKDEAGNVLDNDEADRADPMLLFRPETAGRIHVLVRMKACEEETCEYALGFHALRSDTRRDGRE